jgi:hypothetical protein
MKFLASAITLAVVGLSITGCVTPKVVRSNSSTVVIDGVVTYNSAESLRLAESECQKYGRHAVHVPDGQPDYKVTYDCESEK